MAGQNTKGGTMKIDGQFARYYRKFIVSQNHMFKHTWISEDWRRAKYWKRVAIKWRDKMRRAKQ